jgi:hypothetical protein
MPPPNTALMRGADGSLLAVSAGGPEQPGAVGNANVGPGGTIAGGMAQGAFKSVVTRTGPGMSESSSTSFSTNGGPAVASATVSAGGATSGRH